MGYIIGMMNEKQNDPTRAADSQDHRPVPLGEFGADAGVSRCEDAPCCGCCSADGSMVRGGWNGPAHNAFATDGGWPGDGSGMDDLADFNQMEGNDY